MTTKLLHKPVIFFDGNCALCNRTVRFILNHDRQKKFLLCPLQSQVAQKKLPANYLKADTVVLLQNEKLYIESSAAFRILQQLPTIWRLILVFKLLPRSFTDMVYRRVARNRKKWFPQPATCLTPSPELNSRIMNTDNHSHI